MAKIVLTDTCFWLGLVDANDQFHKNALEWANVIDEEGSIFILPWPCLYETISTRLVRSRSRTLEFEMFLKKGSVQLLDDSRYKDAALENVFNSARETGFSYALVDSVIREMIKDIDLRIDYLLTFNASDFIDLCQIRKIDLVG